jgi:hypothetical protein
VGYPFAHRLAAFPLTLQVKGIGLNSFQKFDRLKTAEDRFVVTPNNLTIDAYAIFDTTRGPLVMHVPKLDEARWFIVQIGDALDDVILNLGGTRPAVPGAYLIIGPDYHGRVPGDMARVASRTRVGFVAVRIAVTGGADLPSTVRAREGFHLVPLHTHLVDRITTSTVDYGPIDFPTLTAPDDLALFDRLGAPCAYMLPSTPTSPTPSYKRWPPSDERRTRLRLAVPRRVDPGWAGPTAGRQRRDY